VERLNDLWGEGAGYEVDLADHPHETSLLKLDCSKAESLLHWSPKLSLATALEWIVEWYRGYQGQKDVRLLTEAQIALYEETEAA